MSGLQLMRRMKSGKDRLCPNCLWPLDLCACGGGRKGVVAIIVSMALMALSWRFMG